jgi:hypothetical protein
LCKQLAKIINISFGLKKCARICLKRSSVQNKMYIGSTFENDIKEFDPREDWKYLGTEVGDDIRMRKKRRRSIT